MEAANIDWIINPNLTNDNHVEIAIFLLYGLPYPSSLLTKGEDICYKLSNDILIPYILEIIDENSDYLVPHISNGVEVFESKTVQERLVIVNILLIPTNDDYECIIDELKEEVKKKYYTNKIKIV